MAPIKTRWQWKLRFKSPLAPTRGVWDVLIETNSPEYDNARKVADFYLSDRMPHPSTRFVMLEPAIAFSEDEMLHPNKVDADTGEGPKTATPAQAPFSG